MTSENSGNFYFQFVSSNLDSIELIRARPIAWIDTLILNGIQPVENESQSFWRYLITATTDTFDLTLSESDTLRWVMDWYGEQRGAKGRLRWTGWVVPGENAILVDPIGPFYLTYTPAEYGTRIYMDYWPHEYWVTRSSNGTTIFVMERQGSTEIYGSSAESVGHDGLR